jgi:FMN phosphatase YigB (HAD superfamily)
VTLESRARLERTGSGGDPRRFLVTDVKILYDDPELKSRHRRARYLLCAERLGVDLADAQRLFREQVEALRRSTGREPSGTETLQSLGIRPDDWEAFNLAHVHPAEHLRRDPMLVEGLERLAGDFRLVLLTNMGRRQAERTLEAIGIRPFFELLYTISDSGIVKPSVQLLQNLLAVLEARPERCLFLAPREGVDVAAAEAAGIPTKVVRSRNELLTFAHERTAQLA